MLYNTIFLLRGKRYVTLSEFKKLEQYNTILGDLSDPEELMRWNASEEAAAREELAKHKCMYNLSNLDHICIEEYALYRCKCEDDEDWTDCSEDCGYEFAETVKIGVEDKSFEEQWLKDFLM
ncbi:hypothetical protein FYJ34_12210 [Clostridiaceae bacterium 68-1-5]|uniref:Uncharacterized protein n=1 Tax=Suipraeoptans intestinalis TaxID=2606628 RepID=A0A6N7V2U1_9FIRM|nr:hypothetical protein [Suipraeoptans intestinalis]MSR93944.1 hypothetical protein [Suipraeoptans intestinalis]MSR94919.1 hypothetical protein [Suipraeoptans intestinalis]